MRAVGNVQGSPQDINRHSGLTVGNAGSLMRSLPVDFFHLPQGAVFERVGTQSFNDYLGSPQTASSGAIAIEGSRWDGSKCVATTPEGVRLTTINGYLNWPGATKLIIPTPSVWSAKEGAFSITFIPQSTDGSLKLFEARDGGNGFFLKSDNVAGKLSFASKSEGLGDYAVTANAFTIGVATTVDGRYLEGEMAVRQYPAGGDPPAFAKIVPLQPFTLGPNTSLGSDLNGTFIFPGTYRSIVFYRNGEAAGWGAA